MTTPTQSQLYGHVERSNCTWSLTWKYVIELYEWQINKKLLVSHYWGFIGRYGEQVNIGIMSLSIAMGGGQIWSLCIIVRHCILTCVSASMERWTYYTSRVPTNNQLDHCMFRNIQIHTHIICGHRMLEPKKITSIWKQNCFLIIKKTIGVFCGKNKTPQASPASLLLPEPLNMYILYVTLKVINSYTPCTPFLITWYPGDVCIRYHLQVHIQDCDVGKVTNYNCFPWHMSNVYHMHVCLYGVHVLYVVALQVFRNIDY